MNPVILINPRFWCKMLPVVRAAEQSEIDSANTWIPPNKKPPERREKCQRRDCGRRLAAIWNKQQQQQKEAAVSKCVAGSRMCFSLSWCNRRKCPRRSLSSVVRSNIACDASIYLANAVKSSPRGTKEPKARRGTRERNAFENQKSWPYLSLYGLYKMRFLR